MCCASSHGAGCRSNEALCWGPWRAAICRADVDWLDAQHCRPCAGGGHAEMRAHGSCRADGSPAWHAQRSKPTCPWLRRACRHAVGGARVRLVRPARPRAARRRARGGASHLRCGRGRVLQQGAGPCPQLRAASCPHSPHPLAAAKLCSQVWFPACVLEAAAVSSCGQLPGADSHVEELPSFDAGVDESTARRGPLPTPVCFQAAGCGLWQGSGGRRVRGPACRVETRCRAQPPCPVLQPSRSGRRKLSSARAHTGHAAAAVSRWRGSRP